MYHKFRVTRHKHKRLQKLLRDLLEAEVKLVKAKPKENEISIRLSPEDFSALKKLAPNGDVEGLVREQITYVARHANGYGD